MAATTLTKLDVVLLSPHIGAEIRGIDLRTKPDEATVKAIYQAWLDHLVLVFPGQQLEQEDFVRVTEYFGALGPVHRPPKYHPPGFKGLLPGILMISNIRENGEPIGVLPDGEMMFHHDMIHTEVPSKATILYSLEIPSHGGDTLFASGYAAYDTLDPKIRERLEGTHSTHTYYLGSTQRGDNRGIDVKLEQAHPTFRTHEETGRKAIYVNRLMTQRILELPEDESTKMLERLFDHMERPEFVYAHKWRVGDVLLWDNRCSTHARTDFPTTERRLMLRTTVRGTVKPV